jgi:Type VI secretion system (T6SS), amidase effector protein 4
MPPSSKKFKTNSKEGSTAKVAIKVVTFKEIWNGYPSSNPVHLDPQTKQDMYDSHCAIKVGEALLNAGISLESFPGGKCQHCPRKDGQRHPLSAQALANWLSLRPFPGCSAPLNSDGTHYEKDFDNRTRIIFFADYWQRKKETGSVRTGDHIDLWDDKTLASLGVFESFVRVNMGFSIDGWFSDFGKAKQVLFWEIK